MLEKKTRIVCTIGPATESDEMLEKLIKTGMNVARLNTSHGDPQIHGERTKKIQEIREKLNVPIAVLLDLEGPKMRTKNFKTDEVTLVEGNEFILTSDELDGDEHIVSLTYSGLVEYVQPKDFILLNDGKVKLEVIKVDKKNIYTKIINGGTITHRRGINVPGVDIKLPGLTKKDKLYIENAVKWGIDYIAQSFVRKPEDVKQTKNILKELGAPDIPVIVKIETLQAIENLESIIDAADGVMVARGDLGVEVPVQKVPLLQKRIIELANAKAKPVITATQMLETMIENPVPTRAEASDIANAILDGTDAVMLSAETSVGAYPIEAVKVMVNVAKETEEYLGDYTFKFDYFSLEGGDLATNAISKAAIDTAEDLNIDVIVASTYSGYTARALSRFRRSVNIIAASPRKETYNRMALVWGVTPVIMSKFVDTDSMLNNISNIVRTMDYSKKGDNIIVTAGIPYGFSGTTNLLKVHEV
ncbi:pyruvate kinase [Oceanotoga sp. DSM 15011]|uniref:pyruvate kinase n=1 Tax=Oceanotoga sp. DSM 15011 TaxID=2984951 RepID=UPI0021F4637C|nr:pyruvate kinase [Oceanotoga sp. DSM 15011]UYP00474.1 pyruvate kinase [Oceanotoga sp. DSM 15011]